MNVNSLRSTLQYVCHRMKLDIYPAKFSINWYQKAEKLIDFSPISTTHSDTVVNMTITGHSSTHFPDFALNWVRHRWN